MKRFTRSFGLSLLLLALALATVPTGVAQAEPPHDACWGQATAAFAQLGLMGAHASSQDEPRAGLGNLARQLYADGVIEAPTLQALAAYLAAELGLDVSACM